MVSLVTLVYFVVQDAVAGLPDRGAEQSWVAPLPSKVTVPVEFPAPGAFGVTVADSVTVCPTSGVVGVMVRAVVVDAASTTSSRAADVVEVSFVSPPYVATISSPDVEAV